jgi:hypothetical protein
MKESQVTTDAKLRPGSISFLTFLLVALVALSAEIAWAQSPPVRALVLTDLGESAGIATTMRAEGWTVTESDLVDLASRDLLSQFEVVWIPGERNSGALHDLVDGELVVFALEGGVVVVSGVNGASMDVAPGGIDAQALTTGAGAVSISSASHASITGDGIGGSALTDADLDPTGGGGRGSLHEVPAGAVVIAQNADGPVAVEYGHGDGHVLVATLYDPVDACTRNVVLYAGSLIP